MRREPEVVGKLGQEQKCDEVRRVCRARPIALAREVQMDARAENREHIRRPSTTLGRDGFLHTASQYSEVRGVEYLLRRDQLREVLLHE